MPRRKEPRIPDAILDQLLAGADPKTAFDPNGLLDGLKKAPAERALNAEMDHHLGGEEDGSVSARASKYRCAELRPVVTQAASKMPSTATVLRRSQPSSVRAVARDLTEPVIALQSQPTITVGVAWGVEAF